MLLTCGLNCPISLSSSEALTASISTKPNVEFGAINPGYTCFPDASITISCLAGFITVASPMFAIFPSIIEIKLFSITFPFPKCALAPKIKIDLLCFGAGVCWANPNKEINKRTICFFIINCIYSETLCNFLLRYHNGNDRFLFS